MRSDMKKFIAIILIFLAFNNNVKAKGEGESDFTFGIEWGFIAQIHSGYHYNFFAPEGFRVDEIRHSFKYRSNADMYIHGGKNFGKYWNFSLYVGYAGVGDIHNVMPISLRATRFFDDDQSSDRWFAFIDAGSGISFKIPVQEIITGKIGGGYRLALSKDTGIDMICAVRMTYTHPQIIYDKEPIDFDMVNRSNAYVSAVSIGLALTF